MYRKIEKLYKKQSPYNKIKKKIFKAYIIVILFLLLFNVFNSSLLLLLTVIITIVIMKKICEKELNIKLHFKFNNKDTKGEFLNEIICDRENEMFKNFLKKIKWIIQKYQNALWNIIGI